MKKNTIIEIKKMLSEIAEIDFFEYDNLMQEFQKIRKKYDDANNYDELYKYKVWNSVIGSTIVPDKMPFMDLPGNIIQNMIREIYEKVTNK